MNRQDRNTENDTERLRIPRLWLGMFGVFFAIYGTLYFIFGEKFLPGQRDLNIVPGLDSLIYGPVFMIAGVIGTASAIANNVNAQRIISGAMTIVAAAWTCTLGTIAFFYHTGFSATLHWTLATLIIGTLVFFFRPTQLNRSSRNVRNWNDRQNKKDD